MKLILPINVIMPTNVDIPKGMSRKILDMRVLSGILIGLVSKLNFILSRFEARSGFNQIGNKC